MKKLKKARNNRTDLSDTESDNRLNDYEDIGSDGSDTNELLRAYNEDSNDSSSEEEVFPVHSGDLNSSEDESETNNFDEDSNEENDFNMSDSDIENVDDDILDSRAWGKHKNVFYNADRTNDKNDFRNEEDEEAAKLEEEEARIIQKRLVSEIDNTDLSFDLLSDVIFEKKEDLKEKEKIEIDLTQMNEQEKLKLLKSECPELLVYVDDYKRLMLCVRDELLPLMQRGKTLKLKNTDIGEFIHVYNQLITNYCTNIVFYILLKCRRTDTKPHPVSKWIKHYQSILNETEPIYQKKFKPLIENILSGNFNLTDITSKKSAENSLSKNNSVKSQPNRKKNNELIEVMEKQSDNDELHIEDENEENEIKRPITYQISKNKGLTPYRQKKLRNPRVKHRMKYRKAKIRRKGQVREVRKELQKYAGEISGIKAGVVKSIKFKK